MKEGREGGTDRERLSLHCSSKRWENFREKIFTNGKIIFNDILNFLMKSKKNR